MQTLVIGTRGSDLAIEQAEIVKNLLLSHFHELQITIKVIKTEGDKNMSSIPLDTIGKGWFTKEIEQELLDKKIDIAAHSLKDLPELLPGGLSIGAILERADARDVFLSHKGIALRKLKKGAIIGTDSIRRKIQIQNLRPDIFVQSIRGNIQTRLKKFDEGNFDGLILAAAGLQRLHLESRITEYFSFERMLPSPGQGALAVEARSDDSFVQNILKPINHIPTMLATQAERSFALHIGGGCKTPTGAYAFLHNDILTITGLIGTLDGMAILRDTISGNANEADDLGKKLALQILDSLETKVL